MKLSLTMVDCVGRASRAYMDRWEMGSGPWSIGLLDPASALLESRVPLLGPTR
jgi:hypothetical protein